jgi:ferrous iron transport protein A
MSLWEAQEGKEYTIKDILTEDDEVDAFLFTLGCYAGEPVTVVFRISGSCVVSIKDGRYSIDKNLAKAIFIE